MWEEFWSEGQWEEKGAQGNERVVWDKVGEGELGNAVLSYLYDRSDRRQEATHGE